MVYMSAFGSFEYDWILWVFPWLQPLNKLNIIQNAHCLSCWLSIQPNSNVWLTCVGYALSLCVHIFPFYYSSFGCGVISFELEAFKSRIDSIWTSIKLTTLTMLQSTTTTTNRLELEIPMNWPKNHCELYNAHTHTSYESQCEYICSMKKKNMIHKWQLVHIMLANSII